MATKMEARPPLASWHPFGADPDRQSADAHTCYSYLSFYNFSFFSVDCDLLNFIPGHANGLPVLICGISPVLSWLVGFSSAVIQYKIKRHRKRSNCKAVNSESFYSLRPQIFRRMMRHKQGSSVDLLWD